MKKSPVRNKQFFFVLLISLVLTSCSYDTGAASTNATATPWIIVVTYTPTENLAPVETSVVETFSAQLTETAIANPTETPVPATETPEVTETQTATQTSYPSSTMIYWTPMPPPPKDTPVPEDEDWDCSITFQLVSNNQVLDPYEDFDARWTIKNTGEEIWLTTDVDYRYMSGTEMQTGSTVYDLPSEVDPGESITITIDMKAPGAEGHYETFWALARHSDGFCWLPTRIEVRD